LNLIPAFSPLIVLDYEIPKGFAGFSHVQIQSTRVLELTEFLEELLLPDVLLVEIKTV
jgi:hypothetical protein